MNLVMQVASILCLVMIAVGLPVMFGLLILMTRDVIRNSRLDKEDRRWYELAGTLSLARKRQAEMSDENGYTLGDYVTEPNRS